jgi:hypothetical protein
METDVECQSRTIPLADIEPVAGRHTGVIEYF